MNRKIELAKKKKEILATQQELTAKEIKARQSLLDATKKLYDLINGQEQYDFTKLEKQLEKIDKSLDLSKYFTNLERSIKDNSPHAQVTKTKIQDFSKLLEAIAKNKPIPFSIDLTRLEKAVVNIEQYIQNNSGPSDQGAENYQPVRRVIKVGNRFIFDDNFSNAGGGGGSSGGGTTDGLTDAQLRASPVPVSATIDTTGLSTSANQTTIIGHVDGIEGSVDGIETLIGTTNTTLGTIDTDTGNIATSTSAIDTNAGATSDAASTAGGTGTIAAKLRLMTTQLNDIDGNTNGIETLLTAIGSYTDAASNTLTNIDADTGAMVTDLAAIEVLLTAVETLITSTNSKLDTANTSLGTLDNAISGNEMQVDVVAPLPAGTNAIGKLSANSGVDIGDVDVTSSVSATLDHGSNLDIDTTAEQITTTSFAAKFGVTVKSAATNTGTLYIGDSSSVTAGTTGSTDGFPLEPGESITLPVNNPNLLYAIASVANQKVFWSAV